YIDAHWREREGFQQILIALPRQTTALASAGQPLVPGPRHVEGHALQTPTVAADSEVVIPAQQSSHETGMLRLHRLVPTVSAKVGDGIHRPTQSLAAGLEGRHPLALEASPPVDRKAPEVEAFGAFPLLLRPNGSLEADQPSLVRVQLQAESFQPLAQHREHPFRIVPTLETHHESSGPGELHPQALPEPDGKLAPHPALMTQSPVVSPSAKERTAEERGGLPDPANELRWCSDAATVCISCMPIESGHVPGGGGPE